MEQLSRQVVINLPDGELKLRKLSPSDFITLAEIIQSQRKKLLLENLTAVDAPLDDKLRELANLDARQPRWGDVIGFVCTPAGGVEAMKVAFKKAGKPESDIDDILDQFQDVCLKLIDVEVSKAPPVGKDASRDPSLPETGDEKRPE